MFIYLVVIGLIIILFLCILCIYKIILNHKRELAYENITNLSEVFVSDKLKKIEYLVLPKSNVNEQMQIIFIDNHKKLYFENSIYKNKNYLLALSKFIDYKINTCKQTFRSKDSIILIDEISKTLAFDLLKTNKCEIFSKYKNLINVYSIKQKENKMFKLLLSQKLFYILIKLENELIEISNVIKNAKTTKKVHKYNKRILFNAQIYSIKKFNRNSSKLLYSTNLNVKKLINELLLELFESEYKIKIIINYLITMFS